MTETMKSLEELRREIDGIDAAMHELILRRTRVVTQVAAAKGKTGGANFVPGREARVLRQLLARHDGPFPRPALARIWREMISVYAAMQGPYALVAYADGDDQTCWDLARDQFGSHSAMTPVSNTRDVVARVFSGDAALGVVPIPHDDDVECWWRALCVADAPRVVARLPFVPGGNARGSDAGAYAIARVPLDDSGDDRSLLVIESEDAIRRETIHELLAGVGLHAGGVVSRQEEIWMHLIEVDGFVAPDDPVLGRLEDLFAVSRACVIGGFAVPVADPVAASIPLAAS
jgi:chorismate mutase